MPGLRGVPGGADAAITAGILAGAAARSHSRLPDGISLSIITISL